MAEHLWPHCKVASVSTTIEFGRGLLHKTVSRYFSAEGCVHDDLDWRLDCEFRETSKEYLRQNSTTSTTKALSLKLYHLPRGDIFLEEASLLCDDGAPLDLGSGASGEKHFSSTKRDWVLVFSREVSIEPPRDVASLTFNLTYKTRLDYGNDEIVANLEALWCSGEDTDVEFHVGDDVVRAHKLILTTRLPHFKKLFAAGMAEARTNKIEIADSDGETFKIFLRFVYCGRLEEKPLIETYLNLFVLANKYDVPGLFSNCVVAIQKKLRRDSGEEMREDVNKVVELSETIDVASIAEACQEVLLQRVSMTESTSSVVVNGLILAHFHGWAELKKLYAARLQEIRQSVGANERKMLEAHPDLVVDLLLAGRTSSR